MPIWERSTAHRIKINEEMKIELSVQGSNIFFVSDIGDTFYPVLSARL